VSGSQWWVRFSDADDGWGSTTASNYQRVRCISPGGSSGSPSNSGGTTGSGSGGSSSGGTSGDCACSCVCSGCTNTAMCPNGGCSATLTCPAGDSICRPCSAGCANSCGNLGCQSVVSSTGNCS
jgi:hypothetical protein